ncbi:hypothetical protein SAMN05444008_103199 [Cnuella takakiae]|uniref:Uncharacterized protein n=1 Tax=Cnuella takakiae TaxID=1302690 RepID=A0A1M4X060_9BACT|nr:hypothetical protein SAMN05444008_103199 [Cnuella takakiae]
MQEEDFRKLEIDLPRQPVVNQKSWAKAGWVLLLLVLLLMALAYLFRRQD